MNRPHRHRTWGIHRLDLTAPGLRPDYTLADVQARLAGRSSAGLAQGAWRWGGFHGLQALTRLSATLERRA